MFDWHNHYTEQDAIKCSACLLPQFYVKGIEDSYLKSDSLIGETGLDKRYDKKMPLEDQVALLNKILEYSVNNNCSLTLHCVRRDGILLEVLRKYKNFNNRVLWHGFNGSIETAKELYRLGVIVSVRPQTHPDLKELYRVNPNLVFETDYEGSSKIEYIQLKNSFFEECIKDLETDKKTWEKHDSELRAIFKA